MPCHTSGRRRPLLPGVFCLVAAACTAPETTDSDTASPIDTWYLETPALVEIGEEGRGPAYRFTQITGLRSLSDGTLIVANSGTSEIRAYTSDGEHLWSFGQAGDGPGDFRLLTWVSLLPGDSILAYDNQFARLTVLSRDGRLGRTLSADLPGIGCGSYRPGLSGYLLVFLNCAPRRANTAPGLHRPSRHLTVLDPIAATLTQLAVVDGPEELVLPGGNWTYPAFGLSPVLAARDSIIVYGASARMELEVRDVRGRLRKAFGRPGARQPVTDSLRQLYEYDLTRRLVDLARRTGRDTLQVIEGGIRQSPVFADSVPAIGSILIDPELNIWAGEYGLREAPTTRWHVFSVQGEDLGSVRTPARFRVFEVGTDHVLGVFRDEDGLEAVHLYRLVRRQ